MSHSTLLIFSRGKDAGGNSSYSTTEPNQAKNSKETCDRPFSLQVLFKVVRLENRGWVSQGQCLLAFSSGGDFWKILSSSVDFPGTRIAEDNGMGVSVLTRVQHVKRVRIAVLRLFLIVEMVETGHGNRYSSARETRAIFACGKVFYQPIPVARHRRRRFTAH